ncbi:phage holin family protein [Candidatus Azambacteria bacterium]|nr:phage holin family protein [Candidatus Azambacteria bacterium]
MRLILLIAANILALFLASYYIEGVTLEGGLRGIVTVGLVFSAVNFLLKPVLKLVFGPLILLTFGLFIVIINMGVLWITDIFLSQLDIAGMGALFLATLLVSAVNFAVHILVKK